MTRQSPSDTVRSPLLGKDGRRLLSELDAYRYDKAPRLFSAREAAQDMDLEAVKTLVEWKL